MCTHGAHVGLWTTVLVDVSTVRSALLASLVVPLISRFLTTRVGGGLLRRDILRALEDVGSGDGLARAVAG